MLNQPIKTFEKAKLKSNVRHDEARCSDCEMHGNISHCFQIKRVYKSERTSGKILLRILLSFLSAPVLRLQISHLRTVEASNKLVNEHASEYAFSKFWAFITLTKTNHTEDWGK